MLLALPFELLRLVQTNLEWNRDALALASVCKQTMTLLPEVKRNAAATRIQATVRRILVLLWCLGSKSSIKGIASDFNWVQECLDIPFQGAKVTTPLRQYLFLCHIKKKVPHPKLEPSSVSFKNILSWRNPDWDTIYIFIWLTRKIEIDLRDLTDILTRNSPF